jgi:hypothetical protein
MLREDPNYRRLKAGGTGLFGSASYWIGPDHLLVVVMAGYVENYQRFMFSDIQGLIVRKTKVHYLPGFAAAAVAIGCLLGVIKVAPDFSWRNLGSGAVTGFFVLLTLAVVAVSLVLLNWIKGPSCVCHVRTAVQTHPLPHIGRWRKAQQLVAEITPLLMAAQPLGQEEIGNAGPIDVSSPEPTSPAVEQQGDGGIDPNMEQGGGGYVVDDPNVPPRIIPP